MRKERIKLIIYLALALVTLAVFWQVHQFDFVNLDDRVYVVKNPHIRSGLSMDGIRWAFSTTYAEFWHPMTWLSLMLDYELYGLNPGGYHITNLVFHILSSLLLFWLFCRMTGEIWKSAFVAFLFALHPFHVESVAWVSERKDVLSAFFWMLTLCLYVYYTEKLVVQRYLLVILSFILALMSKPMVVMLPAIMILLDYWPLRRFETRKNHRILWQMKEKLPLFILSGIFSIITIFAQHKATSVNFQYSLSSRVINALASFVAYLKQTFWPHQLIYCYDFFDQLSPWQVTGDFLLIALVSVAAILFIKRMPGLFAGWLWYSISIQPVIGIIPRGFNTMADLFTYLPLTGIFIMMAWGIPELIKNVKIKKFIFIPAAVVLVFLLSVLSWQQCGYWKNSKTLNEHALQVKNDNYRGNNGMGIVLLDEGQFQEALEHFNKSICKAPHFAHAYNNRGIAYAKLDRYQEALRDLDEAIRLKKNYDSAYNNKGIVFFELGLYQQAIDHFNEAIRLKPDYVEAFLNRAKAYYQLGNHQSALDDYHEAIRLNGNKIPIE